jgi:hypothetical protein
MLTKSKHNVALIFKQQSCKQVKDLMFVGDIHLLLFVHCKLHL